MMILVIGTPRGGTSCVTGVLHHLGVHIGNDSIPINDMNPLGFFQDVDFEEIFDSCEFMPEYPDGVTTEMINKVQNVIIKRNQNHKVWAAKFRLAAWIVPKFPDAKIIIIERARQASIASLQYWSVEGDPPSDQVIDRALKAVANVKILPNKKLIVNYEDLLINPMININKIADYIGVQCTNEAINFITPALQRFK